MLVSRRTLMLATAALGAVGVAGIGAATLPDPAPGALVLAASELALVEALAEAMFPPDNPLGVSGAGLGMPERVDELLGDTLDPMVQPVFRHVLAALDAGTLVSRGSRFVALPLADRIDVLSHWDDNDLFPRRAAFDALRLVMAMAYFYAPGVAASIGWRARCVVGAA